MKLDGLTNPELIALRERLAADPKNRNVDLGSIWIYKKDAMKKFDEIDRAITANIRAARLARGETINDAGYSGRQSNR